MKLIQVILPYIRLLYESSLVVDKFGTYPIIEPEQSPT